MHNKSKATNMQKTKTRLAPFFIIAVISVCFLSIISYNILLGSYYDIRSQYIALINEQVIDEIEASISFGKSLDNYYGMDVVIEKAKSQLGDGYEIAIVSNENKINYSTFGKIDSIFEMSQKDHKIINQDIKDEKNQVIGEFITIYSKDYEKSLVSEELSKLRAITVVSAVAVAIIAVLIMFLIGRFSSRPVFPIIITIILAMTLQSVFLIVAYQNTYKETVLKNAEGIGKYLALSLEEINKKGVEIEEISDLQNYFDEKKEYEMIEGIELLGNKDMNDEKADSIDEETILIKLDSIDNQSLSIKVKISSDFIKHMIIGMILNFIAAIAIIFVITAESMKLSQMLDFRKSRDFNKSITSQYKQIAYILRYGNFITSVGSYACLAFSALMIREWNQGAFGLSVGMTAALSISICSLAEVAGLFAAPFFSRRIATKKLIIISTVILFVSNLACFFVNSSAMIILLRAISGLGFAGNKQATNNIIAMGYGKLEERAENINESNAGIVGGIMCGSSMGAIIATTLGYEATFGLAAFVFLIFVGFIIYFIPWKVIKENQKSIRQEDIDYKKVISLIKKPEIIKYSITVNLPMYIYLMIIVVLIPAIIQSNHIWSVVLTYCNLLNGIAGLYLGSKIGKILRARIGLKTAIVLISIIGAVSMLIPSMPFMVFGLIVSSMLLGLVDGAGIPLSTDYFLELKSIENKIDEATALTLLSIIGFAVMTLAPLILELCINNRMFSLALPILLFILSLFTIIEKKEKKNEEVI